MLVAAMNAENLPAAHSTHEFTLIAFVSPEYVPA
jgi:hypothetical protein